MKISTRLSLAFSFIASAMFIVFGIAIYLFVENHRKNEFKERLSERLIITEKIFLEKDAFSPPEFEKIRAQFLNTLPEETEEIIKVGVNSPPIFKYNYSEKTKTELLKNGSFYFEDFNTQGLSKVFNVKGKNFLIIITAVDQAGLQNVAFLKFSIISLILLGIPLILTGSFLITKKALLPLTKKIQLANAISASNLYQRLEVFNPDDEIGEMAISFNKLLDRLELAFDAHKSFISNASHEIKNPLTAIMGEAEIAVSKTRTPEEYKESLDAILSEAEMLNSTVNNLLHLAKVTANEESIRFEPIDFDSFLKEVKTSFDFVNPENKIEVEQNNTEAQHSVSGNKNLLKTAIFNLFDNACKFSDNQEVGVNILEELNMLKLTISDKGQGIAKEEISKIRAPFYRGQNVVQIKGSGIGLSLTDKIITLHKGELHIKSELGIGTVVEFTLPLL